jgi:hypothetical protein
MVSFHWKYNDVIQHCSECGKQMSSFEIGLDHDLCSDCRAYHQDEKESEIKRLESRLANTAENKRLADEEIRNLLEQSSQHEDDDLPGSYCPDCLENPCICREEHPNSYYSDPPGEHEFHDDFDYDDYDSPGGRLYPDPDDDEIFF